MIKAALHKNEEERMKSLESYAILDTLSETEFDNLTFLAAQICDTPISLVTFIDNDRQWFKSRIGLNVFQTPRDYAFCTHAINKPNDVFIVPDSREDERFFDNPVVIGEPNVVFYAGVPLVTEKGLPLGTLCVIDQIPRELTPNQIISLKALANQTLKLLELRLNKMELESTMGKLRKKNVELEKFAQIAAHDLKSPLNNITGLTDFFVESYGEAIDQEGKEILTMIKTSSIKLKEMIDSLLLYSKSDTNLLDSKTAVNLQELKQDLTDLFAFSINCSIALQSKLDFITINKTAIEQILINLIANALKYNDKETAKIEIEVLEEENFYRFLVKDNGYGIAEEHHERIFQLFEVLSANDRFGEKGNGIGLATVKKIVESLHGIIYVESELGVGSKFVFTIKK
ncbi:ATP-binding protein [Flavobacterium sp. TAB 87]|uniref:sensor histidine kinase n=1 Tax=Flavobacterium sp. TAB 87 TaxID=1729581 RepID=UPI00076C6700|nr:ATP-binding protein [Flavobacterium sp. TAB 87]KVV15189.1 Phytochrome-like protein cph1 [Flavobacterium sp. TAB 87]